MEETPCSIQPIKMIRLFGKNQSGCGVVDVNFPTAAGVKISQISFTNYYTASVTIKGKGPANVDNGKFRVLVKDFTLMKNPHYSNESQNHTLLNLDKIGDCEGPFISIRFILKQPSPLWQRFSIDDIKVMKKKIPYRSGENAEQSHKEEITDEVLAKEMKQLYGLVHMVQNIKLTPEPTHFAVDESYDINQLSYS